MTTDAIGNAMVIGQKYGYTTSNNGRVTVVTGVCEKVDRNKTTLGSIEEASGTSGNPGPFRKEDRRRCLFSCHVFPIYDIVELTMEERIKLNGFVNEAAIIAELPSNAIVIRKKLEENKIPKFVIKP